MLVIVERVIRVRSRKRHDVPTEIKEECVYHETCRFCLLIGLGKSEGCLREADSAGTRVKHREEPLEESKAVNEIQAFPRWSTQIAHNKVDGVRLSTDSSVQLYEGGSVLYGRIS